MTEINKRRQETDKNEDSKLIPNAGWLDFVETFFSDCFKQSKQGCKYNPNVKLHYIDVRHRVIDGYIFSNTLYSLEDFGNLEDMENIFALFNILFDVNLLINLSFRFKIFELF